MSLEDRVRRLEEECGIDTDTVTIDEYQYPVDSLRIVDSEVVRDDDSGYCLLWDDDGGHGWNTQKYDMDESSGWWISRQQIPDDVFEEYYEPQNSLPEFNSYQMEEQLDVTHPMDFYIDEDGDLWMAENGSVPDGATPYLFKGEVESILAAMERHE